MQTRKVKALVGVSLRGLCLFFLRMIHWQVGEVRICRN